MTASKRRRKRPPVTKPRNLAACDSRNKGGAYPFQRQAIRAAIGASGTYGHGMRPYPCKCGWWHLTSMPLLTEPGARR